MNDSSGAAEEEGTGCEFAEPSPHAYAGHLLRFRAWLVDLLVWSFGSMALVSAVGAIVWALGDGNGEVSDETVGQALGVWLLLVTTGMTGAAVLQRAQTLGRNLVGLRVLSSERAGVSYGQALLRVAGGFLSTATLGIGYLWAARDPLRRGWPDLLAGTMVAREERATAPWLRTASVPEDLGSDSTVRVTMTHLVDWARSLRKGGYPEHALALVDLSGVDPTADLTAYLETARCFLDAGRPIDTLAATADILAHRDVVLARALRAEALAYSGSRDAAKDTIDALLATSSDDAAALRAAVIVADATADPGTAVAAAERYVESLPDDHDAARLFALLTKDSKAAEAALRRAIESDPNDAESHDALANVLMKKRIADRLIVGVGAELRAPSTDSLVLRARAVMLGPDRPVYWHEAAEAAQKVLVRRPVATAIFVIGVFLPGIASLLVDRGLGWPAAIAIGVGACMVGMIPYVRKLRLAARLDEETRALLREAIRATTSAPAARVTWGKPSPFGGIDLGTCHCAAWRGISGAWAMEYGRRHLGVRHRLSPAVVEMSCPDGKGNWIWVLPMFQGGAMARVDPSEDRSPGQYL